MTRIPFKKIYSTIFFSFFALLSCNTANAQLSMSAAIGAAIKSQFSTGKIQIDKIILEEPHIVPKESMSSFFSKFEGKEIGVEELKEIQTRLSKYYYAKGYINSGVIIPNQRITDGIIRLRAIHGRLSRVKVAGNDRISNAYVRNAVAKGVTVPLNSHKLQEALEYLQKHPLIDSVKAHMFPGDTLGESILQLDIEEKRPYFLSSQVSNYQSPSIGQYRLGINFGHRDLLGFRDTLSFNIGLSEGLKDGNIDYTLPIGVEDYLFNAYASYGKFTIVDEAFSEANIKSQSTNFGISFNTPLYDVKYVKISTGIGLEVKHMALTIFGEKASIADGFDENGESNSTPVVFHFNGVYQHPSLVAAIYAGIRRGTLVNLYSGSDDGRIFTIGVGQLTLAVKPIPQLEWQLRINGQLTRDNLPPAEKYSIGGNKSVRGYRENLLVRDNGVVISSQLRFPVYKSKVFVVPFVDYGRSWNIDQGRLGGAGTEIYSVGAGIQWKVTKAAYTELFWGRTLSEVDTESKISQDYSLHFMAQYSFY